MELVENVIFCNRYDNFMGNFSKDECIPDDDNFVVETCVEYNKEQFNVRKQNFRFIEKVFKDDFKIVEDMPSSGGPLTTSMNEQLKNVNEILFRSPQANVGGIGEKLDNSHQFICLILVFIVSCDLI